jgi:hypothetical protein
VELLHGGKATFVQFAPVYETFGGSAVWEGVVHVFDRAAYPNRDPRLCWSSPIEGSTKRQFFALLHQPPVDSPQAAVRTAIVAEQREGS